MKLPYAEPDPAGSERARQAKAYRDLATEISRLTPQALTRTNGEEDDHGPMKDKHGNEVGARYPANFTKGLMHDDDGLLQDPAHYRCFVEAINAPDPTLFEKDVVTAEDVLKPDKSGTKAEKTDAEAEKSGFNCPEKTICDGPGTKKVDVRWRGWESPRAGHVYELQGPDAGAVGMAPAPRVGSSELAAEMAEVYALAILRDVPFSEIAKGGDTKLCGKDRKGTATRSAKDLVADLNKLPFFAKGKTPHSSTPHQSEGGLNRFERNRRAARTILGADGKPTDHLTTFNAFRGSTKGAQMGPYISQFMLMGNTSFGCADPHGKDGKPVSVFPGKSSAFGPEDGFIRYGTLIIDQRTLSHKNCLDYMTDWCSWLDVQNGANMGGADQYEPERRFITTPRDLATYVHFDALYEAYLNAALIMLGLGIPSSKGFPEPSPSGRRTPFATFGGPHILSLVCEVATRCLKAVRRQKFNYHRRARPEALGGRLTLACLGNGHAEKLGCTEGDFAKTLAELKGAGGLIGALVEHNKQQNALDGRRIHCSGK